MLSELTAEELMEWRGWLSLEGHPLDNLYELLSVGFWAICATLGNKNLKPTQFMPQYLKDAHAESNGPDFEQFAAQVSSWHSPT